MSRFDAPIEKNFSFVNTSEPADAEEGQTWYDPGDDVARVYNGNSWEQMNITQHGSLSGVTEGQHRSDQRVADLAPVQSVGGQTGDVDVPSAVIWETKPDWWTNNGVADGDTSGNAVSDTTDGSYVGYSGPPAAGLEIWFSSSNGDILEIRDDTGQVQKSVNTSDVSSPVKISQYLFNGYEVGIVDGNGEELDNGIAEIEVVH